MMEKVLISNQVYEAVQAPTLEEDPLTRGHILYANRYSGIQPVELEDSELLEVINSTIGMSGSNVLIQLKQKMEKFRNGPWYIDSKDGVVYIHNRKLNQESVTNYIYQQENGELLSAEFSIQEVRKPLAGFKGFIDGITKAVGAIQQQQNDILIASAKTMPVEIDNSDPTSARSSTWYDNPWMSKGSLAQQEYESKSRAERLEVKAQKEIYDAKDPATLKKESLERAENNRKKLGPEFSEYWLQQSPRYKYYLAKCETYGKNSKEAQAEYEKIIEQYRENNVYVDMDKTQGVYGYYQTTVYTGDVELVSAAFNEDPMRQKPNYQPPSAMSTIESWKSKNPDKIFNRIITYDWKSVITKGYSNPGAPVHNLITWKGTIVIEYFGTATKRSVARIDLILKDTMPRYFKNNPQSIIQNAMNNIGRGKKEKQLRAILKVVGNPVLESMQQIGVYNVGNKHSGLWYIKSVDHSFEFGQGYTCEIELSKQIPKPGSTGEGSLINTQGYTKDLGTASTSDSKTGTQKRSCASGTETVFEYRDENTVVINSLSSEDVEVLAQALNAGGDARLANEARILLAAKEKGIPYATQTVTKDKEGKLKVRTTRVEESKVKDKFRRTNIYFTDNLYNLLKAVANHS